MFEYSVIFLVCTLSGVLTGLLGIGGGLIIVPAFLTVLPACGLVLPLHKIIGISATCVCFNSISGVFYRRKEKFMAKPEVLKTACAIISGTLLGAYYSSSAPNTLIFIIYISVAFISIYLLKHNISFDFEKFSPLKYLSFALIGAISASIGIGGAVMFAAALKCFTNKDTKELLPTITLLVAIHAIFAFVGKFFTGDITLIIIPIAIISSLIGAKIGIKISRRLSAQNISNLMILALYLGIIRVFIEFFRLS